MSAVPPANPRQPCQNSPGNFGCSVTVAGYGCCSFNMICFPAEVSAWNRPQATRQQANDKPPEFPHNGRVEKLFEIIHEDAELLVINKPAGLVCHPSKNGELSSLIGRARLHLKDSAQPHLVNRLDRETSGVIIVAKNSEVAGELGKALENRAVEKEYLAIVHGNIRDDHGLIDAPLGKDEHSIVAVKDCVRPDGAQSQTAFWVERRVNGAPASGTAGWRGWSSSFSLPAGNTLKREPVSYTHLTLLTNREV